MTNSEKLDELKAKKDAFSKVYDQYFESLVSYLRKFSVDEELVFHAIQELFLELWKSRNNLDAIQSLKAYLFVSARRKLISLQKSERKRLTQTHIFNTEQLNFQYTHEDFLIHSEHNQIKCKKLAKAINALPDRQKEAVYLRYYEDLSPQEISAIQGIAYQSVLNNLQRAYKELRDNPLILSLLK
ncbi:RNA polymerase sigma factor [Negadavirga shengliensis]|uniref:RNA polymerase sigma factor n=1 Tax=Negadavirga shengliensis TaxID=1389218 RepID=A0ABV9SVT6_9BACT